MGILTPFIGPILELIGKVIPDPSAKQAAQLRVLELQSQGELAQLEADVQLALGQVEVNKIEASQTSLFRAGWRPFVGWVCGSGLTYQFLLQPLLVWCSSYADIPPPPALDLGTLTNLLAGLLGLGAFRSYEKIKGLS